MGLTPEQYLLLMKGKGFIPTRFPGCKLWLPAEQGISLLSPSADRAHWHDRSGNFNHVNQVVNAKKPGLPTGIPRLEFEKATAEHLTRAVLAGVSNGYTIGLALRMRALGVNQYVLQHGGTGGNGVALASNSLDLRRTLHQSVAGVNWGSSTLNPERWIARHDGPGASADFCLNGVHQAPQGLANDIPATGTTVICTAFGSVASNVDIYATYLYPTRLNDADTLLLDAQLAALQAGTTPPGAPGSPDLALERPDLYSGQAMSDWANQGTAGAARDIAQALAAKQMILIPGITPAGGPAVYGDGIDDFMAGTWTQGQPEHDFAVALFSEAKGAGAHDLWNGVAGNTHRVWTTPATDNRVYAHAGVQQYVMAAALDTFHRIEVGYNGASSRIRIDDISPFTGNLGTAASDGLILAAWQAGSANWADSLTAEIIRYAGMRTTPEQTQLHAYLARHGC